MLAVHIVGLHAADLIQECANACAAGSTVRDLSYMVRSCLPQFLFWSILKVTHVTVSLLFHQVHTHPTLSEVLDSAFKGAVGMASH